MHGENKKGAKRNKIAENVRNCPFVYYIIRSKILTKYVNRHRTTTADWNAKFMLKIECIRTLVFFSI